MAEKPDGGPAYPCLIYGVEYRGMTVRQRYAKAAMQGMLSRQDFMNEVCKREGSQERVRERIAEYALAQADAMIAAEDKEPDDA